MPSSVVGTSSTSSATERRIKSRRLRIEARSCCSRRTRSITPNSLHSSKSLRLGHGMRLGLGEDLRWEEFGGRVGSEGGEGDGCEGGGVRAGVDGGDGLGDLHARERERLASERGREREKGRETNSFVGGAGHAHRVPSSSSSANRSPIARRRRSHPVQQPSSSISSIRRLRQSVYGPPPTLRSLRSSPRSRWYSFVPSPPSLSSAILEPSPLRWGTAFEVAGVALDAGEGCAKDVAVVQVVVVVGASGGSSGRRCSGGRGGGGGVVTLELLEEPGDEGRVVVGGYGREFIVDLLCNVW